MKTTKAVLKLATLNIRGGGSAATQGKWNNINQIIRDKKIDILAIQESHLNEAALNNLNTFYHKRMRIWNSEDPQNPSAGKGVSIVLNKERTSWAEAKVTDIIPGRALLLELPWKNRKDSNDTDEARVNILAIYAPNTAQENANFWSTLSDKWIDENLPIPDAMLGDFNIVEEAIDRLPPHRDNAQAASKLADFKSLHTLQDGWRHCYPTELAFSYTQVATQSRSRIDCIYVSTPIYKHARNWIIEHTPINTDHCLVSMEFANPGAPFIGKGRWSIPLYLIKHRKVLQDIELLGCQLEKDLEAVSDEARTGGKNPQTLYHTFKKLLTHEIREFSKVETPKMEAHIKSLKVKLRDTLNDTQEPLEVIQAKAAQVEEKIKHFESIRHTKIRDNVAAKYRLESETMSKSWINANKDKRPRDTIAALRVLESPLEQPIYTKKTKEMAELARSYHEDLQTNGLASDVTEDDFQDTLRFLKPKLTPREKAPLAEYITQDEVHQALRDLPDGKAAGMDGIPHELWKALAIRFKHKKKDTGPKFNIIKCLTQVYNDIERHGLCKPSDFPQEWMCPLYKKGETTEISNYRPITVLNTDYKIMTQVLTTRLTKAVPNLIHTDQAGFMCGRRIEDQTDLVRLMLDNCEVSEINGVIVCLDQKKAYDKIRHDFIWKTLQKFDFPKHFIDTLKTLYENGETVIIINGVISKPYRVTRGVRQGDPLSCLIFNLAIESLASMLRDSTLRGLEIPGDMERLITTLFANDTTVYLSEEDKFDDLQQILQKWCYVSGAKFNVKKTVVIPVGTPEYRESVISSRQLQENQNPIPNDVKIATDGTPVRVLGAFVGNKVNQLAVWTPTLEKIDRKLERWSRNHLTQDGKRLIIGMVVGGLTQYLTRVQGMTEEVTTLVRRKITKFLWDDASPMVSAQTMSGKFIDGGKKILDIQARNDAIDLMRLKSYLRLDDTHPRWAKVADILISRNIPKSQNIPIDTSRVNTFLQTWTPTTNKTSKLPSSLCGMLKTATKYQVDLDPPFPSQALHRCMPVWYHKGQDEGKYPQNNGRWAKCQRSNHKIQTVGEIYTYINETNGLRHFPRSNCACVPCKNARNKGCKNPTICRKAAQKLLDTLHPKWRLTDSEEADGTQSLSEQEKQQNEIARETGGPLFFNPDVTSLPTPTGEFRIFVEPGIPPVNNVAGVVDNQQPRNGELTVSVWGTQVNTGCENAKSAFAIWYGVNDPRNFTSRTRGNSQTRQMGEYHALLAVLSQTPSPVKLHIRVSSSYTKDILTKYLSKNEEKGWSGIAHRKILQIIVATLRARRGKTTIDKIRDQEIKNNARELARVSLASAGDIEEPHLVVPEAFQITGVSLAQVTQSILYQEILNLKKAPA